MAKSPFLGRQRRKPIPYGPYKPGGTYVLYGPNHTSTHVTYIGRNSADMHQFVDHKTGLICYTGRNPPVQTTPMQVKR